MPSRCGNVAENCYMDSCRKSVRTVNCTASWRTTDRCPASRTRQVAVSAGDQQAAANLCFELQTETSEASPGTSSVTDGTCRTCCSCCCETLQRRWLCGDPGCRSESTATEESRLSAMSTRSSLLVGVS